MMDLRLAPAMMVAGDLRLGRPPFLGSGHSQTPDYLE